MQLEDLVGEEHLVALPRLRPDRHVLDEPHLEAVLAAVAGQRHHVVLGEAADGDRVHLDRLEAGRLRRVEAGEHLLQPVAAGQFAEPAGVERVEPDVEPPQAGVVQRPRPARRAGCRWSSARCRVMPGMATSMRDQLVQVAPHQRLAAGQPDLVDAQPGRDADERARSPRT